MGVVLVVVLLLSFLWGGCEEEFPYNEWEYQMDLATFKTTPEPMFVLDNGVELLPESRSAALSVLLEGDRCLLLEPDARRSPCPDQHLAGGRFCQYPFKPRCKP